MFLILNLIYFQNGFYGYYRNRIVYASPEHKYKRYDHGVRKHSNPHKEHCFNGSLACW